MRGVRSVALHLPGWRVVFGNRVEVIAVRPGEGDADPVPALEQASIELSLYNILSPDRSENSVSAEKPRALNIASA